MNKRKEDTINRMNELGALGRAFSFIIDFDFEKPLIFEDNNPSLLLWETPEKKNLRSVEKTSGKINWELFPVNFKQYQQAFSKVQYHIQKGDTYLLNLTQPSRIKTNLDPETIFQRSEASYKIWLKNQFICFSPEIFIRINQGIISSYPMKGTISANIPDAEHLLLNDEKEVAEHSTIVDLIRNDLSKVATNVQVDRFRYIDRINTHQGDLLQMSSQISGKLPENYTATIGSIIDRLLPAGSICGAPKHKTVEIIREVEGYQRGYYTGIFGTFDGKNLDSCVLIRYLELENNELIFKSGGGITFLSNCQSEYNELIQKVYVPIT